MEVIETFLAINLILNLLIILAVLVCRDVLENEILKIRESQTEILNKLNKNKKSKNK